MALLIKLPSAVIAIATVLTFYTALLHLTRKTISSAHQFRIVRNLIVGTQMLQLYFITQNLHLVYPFLLYPFITLLYLAGTLNYIRYFMFFYPGRSIPLRIKAQLAPAGLIFIGETWFYFGRWQQSQAEIRSVFSDPTQHMITLVVLAGVVLLLIQFGMLFKLEWSFVNSEKVREPVLISSILTIFYMLDNALIAAGFILANRAVMDTGILLLGLTSIIYLLFENRYPSFYQLVAQEERQKKYRKSLIQGLSQDKIMARLQELMEEEKIYRQLELKLEDVAALLFITPHQLSEFVNDCMGMNFASYVNHYRVEEAKSLLVQHADRSALSICFEVGFGSKQSFNYIFKQHTGVTPSEYRKSHLGAAAPANSQKSSV